MKKMFFSAMGALSLVAILAACGGPAADGRKVAQKACQCSKLDGDKSHAAEAEACIEEWADMLEEAMERYQDDDAKNDEFLRGVESVHCD